MSEKDPYAQKRKDSNDESRANDEMMNNNEDTNPDTSGNSRRNPEDDVNPVRPQTNMPNNKKNTDDKDTDTMM